MGIIFDLIFSKKKMEIDYQDQLIERQDLFIKYDSNLAIEVSSFEIWKAKEFKVKTYLFETSLNRRYHNKMYIFMLLSI